MIYFAHSMATYGTRAARDALCRIRQLLPGHRVMDPEKLNWEELEERHGRLGVYRHVISRCARVIALEYAGALSRGAALECELALQVSKPVHVLRGRQILPVCKIVQIGTGDFEHFARVKVRSRGALPSSPSTCFFHPPKGGRGC